MDAALFKVIGDLHGAGIRRGDNLLIVAQADIDIALRDISLFQQRLHGFQNTDEVVFHIHRAASPDKFTVIHAVEGRVLPVAQRAVRHRNHVLVREHGHRLQ